MVLDRSVPHRRVRALRTLIAAIVLQGTTVIALRSAVFSWILVTSCAAPPTTATTGPRGTRTENYTLVVPAQPLALLVLFPCFPCDAADTRSGSKIVDEAIANGVAVMLMEFNRHLFLTAEETDALIDMIAGAIQDHAVHTGRVFIGGFSSGGNVAVLLAKRLVIAPHGNIPLKGIFVVDSPLDLAQLYPVWQDHAHNSPVPSAKEEGAMVVALLDSTLGNPLDSAANYDISSPVTPRATSIAALKDLPFRLYTEPDTAWWRINRGDRYEDMNAFYLEKLAAQLQAAGSSRTELILTKGRGIQHGRRHPHAWSIVEEKDLVEWILSE